MDGLVPRPASGRVYETEVAVRFGDADRHGRLRLDAVARILQDAGNDDFLDAGLDPLSPWVARRSLVEVAGGWPQLGDHLSVATWCGGVGARWAERRTSLTAGPSAVEVATLWVHLDDAGRPTRLPDWFVATYGPAAGDRTVTTRLHLPPPPPATDGRPWQLRATDIDVMGHVNNVVVWTAVEDEASRQGLTPTRAEVEFAGPLDGDDDVELRSLPDADGSAMWLCVGDDVRVAARLEG